MHALLGLVLNSSLQATTIIIPFIDSLPHSITQVPMFTYQFFGHEHDRPMVPGQQATDSAVRTHSMLPLLLLAQRSPSHHITSHKPYAVKRSVVEERNKYILSLPPFITHSSTHSPLIDFSAFMKMFLCSVIFATAVIIASCCIPTHGLLGVQLSQLMS